MIKMLTIVEARPQFIKAAAISRAIRNEFPSSIKELIVHTGQHYDKNMSGVFFEQLQLPREDFNLEAGSSSHGEQTAKILIGIEKILMSEKPDCLMLYGDTNSTLAGAMAAAKLHIPIIHVEGGVRSYNKIFPEEVNRIMCDHVSTMIFTPTFSGMNSLVKEGFDKDATPPYTPNNPKIFHCGDIMYDNSLYFEKVANEKSDILKTLGLDGKPFILATVHRPANTDSEDSLNSLFSAFDEISRKNQVTIVIPLHPRTVKAFDNHLNKSIYESVKSNSFIKIIEPVSFLDIIKLESHSEMVITDSGGVQKEAYFFKVPCIILLEETPWYELVESGSARLAGSDKNKIIEAYDHFKMNRRNLVYPEVYGDGKAASFICNEIVKNFN